MKIFLSIKQGITKLIRYNFDQKQQQQLQRKDCSIICSNCVGGIIYHQLNLPFLSPTINLYIKPNHFVKFCANLRYYLSITPKEVKDPTKDFPVAKLKNITIYAMHYSSFDEFLTSWKRRCKRINWQNICFIMTMRDGATMADLKAFDALPYPKKVVFVPQNIPNIGCAYAIANTKTYNADRKEFEVKELTKFEIGFKRRRLIDRFNYVRFLNEGCWWKNNT